jgi:prepilin-type N-terminal cleavage/methylation domain-containing protein
MNNTHPQKRGIRGSARTALRKMSGFTLVEFMVAMAVFAIIAGSTFSLFRQHEPYFNSQQNLAGTNIAMQNAITQMQLDLSNAGTGYYPGANIPSWPVGVAVTNQLPTTPCNNAATFTYGSQCFDTLSILTMDPTFPPVHATDATGGTTTSNCSYTSVTPSTGTPIAFSGSVFYIQPFSPNAGESAAAAAARTAAAIVPGNQFILVSDSNGKAGSGSLVNTFVVQPSGVATATLGSSGNWYISIPHNPTVPGPTNGQPPSPTNGPANSYTNTATDDPLSFTTVSSLQDTPAAPATKLGNQFCSQDWVMRLSPTTYQVDTSNAQDAKLDRIQAGVTSVIAEQVIGFKVGVATWNNATASASSSCNPANDDGDSDCYHFNPADYYDDYTLVRSVRISLIGRTNPNPDPTYTFRNTFDGGPYQVVGATVVVNPRNMSMNDNY